ATAWAGAPTDAVKKSVDEVIRILEDPAWKKPEKKQERRKLLEQTISLRFNFAEMAKRSLGAEWAKRTPEEQKEFAGNFQTLLANTYLGRIEAYSGEKVQYLKELSDGEYAEVYTKIDDGKSVIDLTYKMENGGGEWRVYDVVIEGTGLVQNYREQFKRILRKDSFAELSKQLRDKSAHIKAPIPDKSDTVKSR
ncbi:MAG TPA: ABC transporter substrate-binding protein, partial [Nitrospirales bacterium]|nr:ABC transporter substrate-binding protein [Nitrospirales bacterium]